MFIFIIIHGYSGIDLDLIFEFFDFKELLLSISSEEKSSYESWPHEYGRRKLSQREGNMEANDEQKLREIVPNSSS